MAFNLPIPTSPTRFSFRPLSTGMVTSETTMAMPNGSFIDVNGYDVTPRGPQKHGAWVPGLRYQTSGLPIPFPFINVSERIEAFNQLFLLNGASVELVITNRGLYLTDEQDGYKRINWMMPYEVTSYSQTTTKTTVNYNADCREHFLNPQDFIEIEGVLYPIDTVTATYTTLTISFYGLPSMVGVDSFEIFKPFNANNEQFVDFTTSRFKLYLVDGSSEMIWRFDGIADTNNKYYLQPHLIKAVTGERTIMGARSISAFNERLYFAGILEEEYFQSVLIPQSYLRRVRWTEVLDHTSCPAANYQDLTRTAGVIRKILGMGNLIMAYLNDGFYYGRQTNLVAIPFAFTYIESANISAVGMKAVSTYFDGQIFMGIDNLYQISSDIQISTLGDAVAESLKDSMGVSHMTSVQIDTQNSRIIVATSMDDLYNDCLWMLNYRSKAWSRNVSLNFAAPSFVANNNYLYYGQVPVNDDYATSPLAYVSYAELLQSSVSKAFFCFINGYFMKYEPGFSRNELVIGGAQNTIENPCELITPDFDFNEPDADKTALRLSLKITEVNPAIRTSDIYFEVWGSKTRGSTWKHLGRMRIKPNRDEDAVNFRFMGSTLRFKLRHGYTNDGTSTDTLPFTVSEVVLRIRERSIETQRSNAREA